MNNVSIVEINKDNFYKECEKGDIIVIIYNNDKRYTFFVEDKNEKEVSLSLRERLDTNYRQPSFFSFKHLENIQNVLRIRL